MRRSPNDKEELLKAEFNWDAYHRGCGGSLRARREQSRKYLVCSKCPRWWAMSSVEQMGHSDLGYAFEIDVYVRDEETLIWKDAEDCKHLALVPAYAASKKERLKI